MVQRRWFPEELIGSRVVLRRHVPGNIAAFRRWYADPEIARLARYQATPMRPEEIERFFAARVVGPDALSMAVHEKATGRLVGTCAFSQLDGENGSALYHITIGESDAWGQGLRHRGHPADARPRVRDPRAAPHRALRLRVQRARHPRLPALRLRRRGPFARVDLARRPLVGRAGDERPRVGLAGAAGREVRRGRGRREPRRPAPHEAEPIEVGGRRIAVDVASSGGGDDQRGSRRPTRRGPTSAS